jgi:peptide/nickel transport system permease protein
MKNAGIAIATLAGVELSTIINGSVIIETVFGWPGIGNLMITAVQQRDLPLVTATVVVVLTLVMVINFAVDMLYAQLDPRIRYQ